MSQAGFRVWRTKLIQRLCYPGSDDDVLLKLQPQEHCACSLEEKAGLLFLCLMGLMMINPIAWVSVIQKYNSFDVIRMST